MARGVIAYRCHFCRAYVGGTWLSDPKVGAVCHDCSANRAADLERIWETKAQERKP